MRWRILLWPFAQVYGVAIWIRNCLFDYRFLKSKSYAVPVISIGNLSMGGTGKTPHLEYLLRMLKKEYKIAVLSRGYGRTTTGYVEVKTDDKPEISGDEPLQFKKKFPSIVIAVCEKRVEGINRLISENQPDLILLDDAFQHRYVKPSLNILLTDYAKPFFNDYLLPAGNLRESSSGKKRADAFIVTKCPVKLTAEERLNFIKKMAISEHQSVFFSFIRYGEMISFNPKKISGLPDFKDMDVLLVCGIADPTHLLEHLNSKFQSIHKMIFPDHYQYQANDLKDIERKFDNIVGTNKLILTTEKDFIRLQHLTGSSLPFYYLPIEIDFDDKDKHSFNQYIIDHVRKNKANS